MLENIKNIYFNLVLSRPRLVLILVILTATFFALNIPKFKLDASSDTLVLENDKALQYYQQTRETYGSDDSLIITFTPYEDLFSRETLSQLQAMRDRFKQMERVQSATSLLDVPLVKSPKVSLTELAKEINTLEKESIDLQQAKQEMLSSELYRNLLLSPDGRTTAMQITFKKDQQWAALREQRNELRKLKNAGEITAEQTTQLLEISEEYEKQTKIRVQNEADDIAEVRQILDEYRPIANIHLGGVKMITVDSIAYINSDIIVFGGSIFLFLVVLLAIAFREIRWVVLPLLTCIFTNVMMVGFLGLTNWPVTVVSSNFISLLLIITLSLTIHLIVRYRELQTVKNKGDSKSLLQETIESKFLPCFYTAITTIVAFSSLIFSDIRPVIDFGWMMSIGIVFAFISVFTLFPALVVLFNKQDDTNNIKQEGDFTNIITQFFASQVRNRGGIITGLVSLLLVISLYGISQLSVENRFIDYFKPSTEIYRGMVLIDKELGGTTPLEVIIDKPVEAAIEDSTDEDDFEDDFLDDFDVEEDKSFVANSHWIKTHQVPYLEAIHESLDAMPETGKVLSIASPLKMLREISPDILEDPVAFAVLFEELPDLIRDSLVWPYVSKDGNQLRYSIRVFESDPNLRRAELLDKIRNTLVEEHNLAPEQISLTGMLVLYNNMLSSLFRSQILTLGVVFIAILLMLWLLFGKFKVALIGISPNIFSAGIVLGLFGLLSIPLDLMTITIAAICIGIAVDNTIHYTHRFMEEFEVDKNALEAVQRSHNSIGRAMYYTSITITLGFSILVLSNFVPNVYFGLMTGIAMLVALIANMTLLPLLLIKFYK